jgi:hypothetical protein
VYSRGKLHQEGIAHGFDDPAPMPVNERREKVFLQLPEDCARALFVSLNKFGIPDDIRNENCRKSPFRLLVSHAEVSKVRCA